MPNYYPVYSPYLPSATVQQAPQTAPTNSIIWVQGEAGAKSYLVGAGQSILLMDSEASRFYIKSTDASGMPMPLRVFEYEERTNSQPLVQGPSANTNAQYVTHEELEKWTNDLLAKLKPKEKAKSNKEEDA